MPAPRILFLGNPQFSVTVLDMLVRHGHTVVSIVANADSPRGRKKIITPPPIKIYAAANGIPIYQYRRIHPDTWKKDIPEADIYIVASYGMLLPAWLLELPRYGVLNVHPSLLPKYRGPSPIPGAILNGESKTGVTIMLTDEKMDHGPIIAQRELGIAPDDSASTLEQKLAKLGGELLIAAIPGWVSGAITPQTQDHLHATFTKIIKKEAGRIDWNMPTDYILRHIRAYTPWPSSWAELSYRNRLPMRIKILRAQKGARLPKEIAPGSIQYDENQLAVATRDSFLIIDELQLEGRKPMTSRVFLRGYKHLLSETVLQ